MALISDEQILDAYKKTGLKPVCDQIYNQAEKSANPLGALMIAAGEPIDQIYLYFGNEFVHNFHLGLTSQDVRFATDEEDYNLGSEYRLKVLSGAFE